MRKQYEYFLLAPLALLLQILTALYIYRAPEFVYGNFALIPEAQLWLLTVTVLLSSGLCGLVLTCRASYLLLTRSRYAVATIMILIFCFPAWAMSVFFLHAALVFLALI